MEQAIIEIQKHLSVLNDELGQVKIDVAILKSQMETLIWWFRALGVAFIGFLVTQVWQLIIMRKNNRK